MKQRLCSIKGIVHQLLTYKRELILGNIIAIVATLLVVVIPLFIPIIVDELLLGKDHGFIAWISSNIWTTDTKGYVLGILAFILLLRLLSTFLSVLQTKIFVSISKNITYGMRVVLLRHLKGVSLKEYEMMRVGAVTSKLVTDVETIDGFVSTTISKLIVSSLILVFSSVVLLWIHWQLALFILLTNPIVVLFTVKLSRNIGKLKKEENRAVELFQSSLNETLELFHQIRAANKENYFFKESESKARELKEHSTNYGYKSDAAMKLSYLVFLAGYEVFRAVSILAVAYSDLSVGLMLAIFSYLWVMVSPTQDIINFQYVLATAKAACKRINTIFEMEQDQPPDVEVSLPVSCVLLLSDGTPVTLLGSPYIYEQVAGRTYRLSAPSFFQVNTYQAEVLVSLINKYLSPGPEDTILDVYCGVGTFALSLATKVKQVIGIESSPSAVADARVNAAGIDNATFILGRVEDTLPTLDVASPLVVMDPPRAGLSKRTLSALLDRAPQRMVYVSCDPATLARDIKRLLVAGYRLREVQPVDMFPQTYHVECVAVLDRG